MKAIRTPLRSRLFLVLLSALVLGISSCGFPTSHPQGMRTLFLAPTRASALVVITNPGSPSARRTTGALIATSERPRQRVLILSSLSGAPLPSSQAPDSPIIQVPAPPVPVPSHPTSFQKARYSQAVGHYQDVVLRAQAALRRQQQQE